MVKNKITITTELKKNVHLNYAKLSSSPNSPGISLWGTMGALKFCAHLSHSNLFKKTLREAVKYTSNSFD